MGAEMTISKCSSWSREEERLLKTLNARIASNSFWTAFATALTTSPLSARSAESAPCQLLRRCAFCRSRSRAARLSAVNCRSARRRGRRSCAGHFSCRQLLGAVAKSNFVSLRFREPVYRSVRELAMSYFEGYFNLKRKKTLRSYAAPFDLRTVDDWNWKFSRERLDDLSDRLNALRHYPLVSPTLVRRLQLVDERTFRGQTLGLDRRGAYRA